MKNTLWILALASVGGCGWNGLPSQGNRWLDDPLWDASRTLPTPDGVYVPLTTAGGLVLVRPDGSFQGVDVGAGTVRSLVASPDGTTVVAFTDRYACDADPDDLEKIDDVEE